MSRKSIQINSNFVQKKSAHHVLNNQNGYILILVCCLIPVILLGTKWVLDSATVHSKKVNKIKIVKKCAREAALKVAQNWNPALSRDQQKESMLRLADEIYNASPAYNSTSPKYNAIPGLEMPIKVKVSKGGSYDPLKVEVVETVSLSPSSKTVTYKEEIVTFKKSYYYYNYKTYYAPMALFHFDIIYRACLKNYSLFSNEDLCSDYCYYCNNSGSPDSASWYHYFYYPSDIVGQPSQDGADGSITKTYTKRTDPNDTTVRVEVEKDKIKVQTDDNIGYATPASCNMDIVLGIPTNGAACNQDNRDANTTTVGRSYISTSKSPDATAKTTPIYQISRAYRKFLKENFFYTRGVNVGVIPYSGNVTLKNSDSDSRSGWCTSAAIFNPDNLTERYLNGVMLYNTDGRSEYSLTIGGILSGSSYGAALLCRGKNTAYNGIYINIGDILSVADPSSYKYYRQVYQPCVAGCANLLSGKCEINCPYQWMNPYFILELNSNLKFIYEMLEAFYPYYDDNNNSNFIFISVTWANNLFQSWSKDPKYDAVDTSKANTNIDQAGGRLSCPSKTTAGRKKALILVVNKPDWFEPGELTYLGYDNDFSEIPMIESDCIKFDVNYSDTSRKFADGTAYNGTIQGAKKILKFSGTNVSRNTTSGYYECNGSGYGTLTFPKKHLIRVVVEPLQKLIWTYKGKGLGQNTGKSNWRQLAYNGSGWMAVNSESYTATSSDALTWSNKTRISEKNQSGIAYANGTYITSSASNWGCYISTDGGNTWVSKGLFGWDGTCDVAYGNGWWFVSNYWATRAFSKDNGANWDTKQDVGKYFGARKDFFVTYSNGIWMALSSVGEIQTTSDLSQENWTSLGNKLGSKSSQWRRICGASKYFVAISSEGITAISRDNGQNWEYANISGGSDWQGLCYGQNRFVACSSGGDIAFSDTRLEGTIEFSSIVTSSNYCTVRSNTITERREFFIEADQINEGSDGNYRLSMKLDNIRLISAGITNRPYQKITPSCSLSGTTNGSGTAYITTNVKGPIKVDAKSVPPANSIEFYNNNGIENNVGNHVITGSQTFTFSGGQNPSGSWDEVSSSRGVNFGHNLSKYKVRYNAVNSRIASATLQNQYLRDYGGQYDRSYGNAHDAYKQLILNDGTFVGKTGYVYSIYSFLPQQYSDVQLDNTSGARNALKKFCDTCVVLGDKNWFFSLSYWWGFEYRKTSGDQNGLGKSLYWNIYGLSGSCTGFSNGGGNTRKHDGVSVSSANCWASSTFTCSGTKEFSASAGNDIIMQIIIKNGGTKSLLSTTIDTTGSQNTNIEQNKGIALQKLSSNLSTKIVAGDYICFQGDGNLSVTVEPVVQSSYLKHYNLNGNEVSELIGTNTTKTVTITPEEYKYEKQIDVNRNVTYKITLKLENIQLSNAKMVDTNKTIIYSIPRLPNNSRCVDYTQNISNRPDYNLNLITFGSGASNTVKSITYDSQITNWVSDFLSSNGSYVCGWHHHYLKDIPGDFYTILDDIGNKGYNFYAFNKNNGSSSYSASRTIPGMYRHFEQFSNISNEAYGLCARYDLWTNTPNESKSQFIVSGLTLPINTMLYCGADGSTLHKYSWQSNSGGAIMTYDATASVQNVTISALKKLQKDYGANVRIYVILYRKQTQYLHLVTKAAMNFSYAYLTNLAANTSTAGTAAASESKPIYKCIDVANESALNSTLSAIASELKTWAGYTEAKIVE